jgi:hypothetical protein
MGDSWFSNAPLFQGPVGGAFLHFPNHSHPPYSHNGSIIDITQRVAPSTANQSGVNLEHTSYQNDSPYNQRSPWPYTIPSGSAAETHQQPSANSVSVSDANMQSMAPPTRKQIAPSKRKRNAATLRRDDWEPVKARVIELHITQKMPLPEVKKIIEDEFGFTAT